MFRILIENVESHLSLSLNRFIQRHPLTIVLNNQMNSVLSISKSIHLETHPGDPKPLVTSQFPQKVSTEVTLHQRLKKRK